MSDNIEVLSQYLNSEKIYIDKKEFDYQLSSHPYYPSLLAISDTLSFFNINNAAIRVPKDKFDLLPGSFIANLKGGNGNFLSFVNKTDEEITFTNSEKNSKATSTSKEEFLNKWDEIVLLAEKEDNYDSVTSSKKNYSWVFYVIIVIFATSVLLFSGAKNYWSIIFGLLPLIGIWLSVYALNDIFNTKSAVLAKFCESSPSSSCGSVINSNKWAIFDKISFSDLSILFFSLQLCSLFLFGLINDYDQYYSIQSVLLYASIPIIFLSLYYQKFVEKKWCPICLSIIAVVLLELIYVLVSKTSFEFNIAILGVSLFLLMASILYAFWLPLKKALNSIKELKSSQLKANRFKRNFQLFKNTLLTEVKNDLPGSLLKLGKTDASIKIAILTSPFCGYCKDPHFMLKSLVEKYGDDIEVAILFNVTENDKNFMDIAKNLIQLKLNKGDDSYYEAMEYWYEVNETDKWLLKYEQESNKEQISKNLSKQHAWCLENNYNFTPCVFINDRKYPDFYEISDLDFFIEDLKEDNSL
ncbi:vitamin K epoxide reductase family protein [Winogradskyella sp. R77965]|uniref:vitamin K epoxide reductase family protein n=1 Tax=Winogradskyella sp. R77965 TaxID=3093872 RepID=UPI0037DD0389